jgi:coproporphyrinogen III oxidase-like Fe-S oxidoreductase
MYRDVSFAISPLEEIVDDLAEAAWAYPYVSRVFLVNGDAFCLPADALLNIAEMIHEALPNVRSIGCYARIPNVTSKTDTELAALAAAGYDNINIGVESGLDDVLALMNKGFTVEEARLQFARLHAAGLPFNVNIINAAAGPQRIAEHAAANAALVNEAQPTLIFVSPLHVDPGTPLVGLIERGEFEECTLGQYLEEEIAFLEGLELDDCVFFGAHVSNPIPVNGLLPRDKDELLTVLRDGMARIPREQLDAHPSKGAEGSLR